MTTGPVWWPTPFRAEDHFSAEEIDASRAYNDPLRRMALLRSVARALLLVVTTASVPTGGPVSNAVWFAIALSFAWWAPAAVTDAWFEFVHERRMQPSHDVLAAKAFGVGSALTLVVTFAVALGALGMWLAILHVSGRWWPVGLVAVTCGITIAAVRSVGSVTAVTHQTEPVDEATRLEVLGVAGDTSATGSPASVVDVRVSRSPASHGHNAFVVRSGADHQLVMTEALAAADPDLRRLIVAHEFAHVRRRDVRSTSTAWMVVGSFVAVAATWSAHRLHLVPVDELPADTVALSSLVLLGGLGLALGTLPLAWLSRGQERRADLDALLAVESTSTDAVRQAYVTDRADLDPPRPAGWWSTHPPAGERLEIATRALQSQLRSKR